MTIEGRMRRIVPPRLLKLTFAMVVVGALGACADESVPATALDLAGAPEPPPTPTLKPSGIPHDQTVGEPSAVDLAPDWFTADPRPAVTPARPALPRTPQPQLELAALPPTPEVPKETGPRYTVRPGETVYAISRRLNVPIRALIDANGLKPPYTLRIGQKLNVPLPRRHVVQPGETVYGISRVYGVDMSELVRANNIQSPYTIAVDQELVLPGQVRVPVSPNPPAPTASVVVPPEPVLEPLRALDPETPPPIESAAIETAAVNTGSATDSVSREVPQTAAAVAAAAGSDGRFLWPVRGEVLSGFGPKDSGLHNDGVNIAAPRGSVVRAAADGVVAYAGNELRGFGMTVLIKHTNGWVTAYAHNESLLVARGDKVERGQAIARVGATGDVTTPQLHFEVRNGSRAVDPLQHMRPPNSSG